MILDRGYHLFQMFDPASVFCRYAARLPIPAMFQDISEEFIKCSDHSQLVSLGVCLHMSEHPVCNAGKFLVRRGDMAGDLDRVAADFFQQTLPGRAGDHQRIQIVYDAFVQAVFRSPSVEQPSLDKDDIPAPGREFILVYRHQQFSF